MPQSNVRQQYGRRTEPVVRSNYKKWPWTSFLVTSVCIGCIFFMAGSPTNIAKITGHTQILCGVFLAAGILLLLPSSIIILYLLLAYAARSMGCYCMEGKKKQKDDPDGPGDHDFDTISIWTIEGHMGDVMPVPTKYTNTGLDTPGSRNYNNNNIERIPPHAVQANGSHRGFDGISRTLTTASSYMYSTETSIRASTLGSEQVELQTLRDGSSLHSSKYTRSRITSGDETDGQGFDNEGYEDTDGSMSIKSKAGSNIDKTRKGGRGSVKDRRKDEYYIVVVDISKQKKKPKETPMDEFVKERKKTLIEQAKAAPTYKPKALEEQLAEADVARHSSRPTTPASYMFTSDRTSLSAGPSYSGPDVASTPQTAVKKDNKQKRKKRELPRVHLLQSSSSSETDRSKTLLNHVSAAQPSRADNTSQKSVSSRRQADSRRTSIQSSISIGRNIGAPISNSTYVNVEVHNGPNEISI